MVFLKEIHDESRTKIDQEIAHLESRILTLKTARNTLAPCAQLHPEVIQEIFVFASRAFPLPLPKEPKVVGKAALTLTWVCRSWRAIAHQTSELWNYIDFMQPTWMETALSRAANRPLSFSLAWTSKYEPDSNRIASLCLQNLPRIRMLKITTAITLFPRLSLLWVMPAPLLVELSLRGVSLPSNLFAGTFPALRTLTLRKCDCDWAWLPIHVGTKALVIDEPVSQTSVENLLNKLRVIASTVERLSLTEVFFPPTHPSNQHPTSTQSRIELPRLKIFGLKDVYAAPVTSLLNHLSLRADAQNNITVSGGEDQYETARAFVSSRGLEKWFVRDAQIHLEAETLTITLWERPGIADATLAEAIGAVGIQETGELVNDQSKPSISLTFKTFNDHSDLIPIFQALPLTPLRTLTFSGGEFVPYGSELTDYFDDQGYIESLTIVTPFVPTFTSIMHWENEYLRDTTHKTVETLEEELTDELREECRVVLSFHHLTTLCYQGRTDGTVEEDAKFEFLFYEVLKEWLCWRHIVGLGLKRLIFKKMHTPVIHDLLALYEGVVDDVDFVDVEEITGMDEATIGFHTW